MKLLNLGCGQSFHNDWVNVDFYSAGPGVLACNLTQGIPFPDNTFNVVYHSHLLEHFSKRYAPIFLSECFRVLHYGGFMRVVVPDLEQIVRWYLILLEQSIAGNKEAQDRYEWIMLELFDQIVRNYSGGEMLRYWQQKHIPAEDFVMMRVGAEVRNIISRVKAAESSSARKDRDNNITDHDPIVIGKFRLNGEIHQWMYDRYSLGKLLEDAGFQNINVCRADESSIPAFNSYLLDIEQDGSARKPDSLFMEAIKP